MTLIVFFNSYSGCYSSLFIITHNVERLETVSKQIRKALHSRLVRRGPANPISTQKKKKCAHYRKPSLYQTPFIIRRHTLRDQRVIQLCSERQKKKMYRRQENIFKEKVGKNAGRWFRKVTRRPHSSRPLLIFGIQHVCMIGADLYNSQQYI